MSKWIKNWFSNMKPFDTPLVFQGIAYNSVENFYQAMKVSPELQPEIAAMSPFEAKKAIRDRQKYPWRESWTKDTALDVMGYALRHKFQKGTSWYEKLMSTGDEQIVEWNNWNDTFWGIDVNSLEGENHLGKLLMKIRDEHRAGV